LAEEEAVAQVAAPDGEAKPKRTRRTKAEIASELPPFHASVVEGHCSATAKRTVRTGSYESFEIMIHAEFDRDPRFSVMECMGMLGTLAAQEANRIADQIQREIVVEK
jgi:hypothetical protein